VHGLSGGLGSDNALHGLDLSDEGRLVAVGIEGHLALLQLEGNSALDASGCSLSPDGHGAPGSSSAGALRDKERMVRLAPVCNKAAVRHLLTVR